MNLEAGETVRVSYDHVDIDCVYEWYGELQTQLAFNKGLGTILITHASHPGMPGYDVGDIMIVPKCHVKPLVPLAEIAKAAVAD